MRARALIPTVIALAAFPAAASAYDENQNWLNAYGRTVEHFSAPDRSVGTALISAQNVLDTLQEADRIPDRGLQQTGAWPWSGDSARGSYDQQGSFTGRKVEFEFDNGAGQALAGTVWAPSDERLAELGLAVPLPGVVYAPGVISAQPMYYWFAQDMANAGYVVMTYDLTGQGRSEGQSQDNPPRDLRAALGFFLSPQNPLRALLDSERIGTAGHSLGASAVQAVGDFGGVVDAISAHSDLQSGYSFDVPIQGQGADYESFIFPPQPSPDSDPDGKLGGFNGIRARNPDLDVQEMVIESATHMAWSHVTWAYTSAWSEAVALHYALAWFDRYLYGDMRRVDGVPNEAGPTGTERTTIDYDAVGGHGLSQKFRSAYSLTGAGACTDMVACEASMGKQAGRAKAKRAKRARRAARAAHRFRNPARPSGSARAAARRG